MAVVPNPVFKDFFGFLKILQGVWRNLKNFISFLYNYLFANFCYTKQYFSMMFINPVNMNQTLKFFHNMALKCREKLSTSRGGPQNFYHFQGILKAEKFGTHWSMLYHFLPTSKRVFGLANWQFLGQQS